MPSASCMTNKLLACLNLGEWDRVRCRTFLFVTLALFLGPTAPVVRGQNTANSIGIPPFSAMEPIENGYINMANGGVHLEVPLGSFPQRGGRKIKASLMYDSNIWIDYAYVGWYPYNVDSGYNSGLSLGGWRLVTSGNQGWIAAGATDRTICGGNGGKTTFHPWYWHDPDGTTHTFNASSWIEECNGVWSYYNASALAADYSGYKLVTSQGDLATVYGPDGTVVYADSGGAASAEKDSNGNYFTSNLSSSSKSLATGTMIDSLGRTLLTSTASNGTYYVDVLNSQGTTSRYTITTEAINVWTNFCNGGLGCTDYNAPMTVIQSVQLPDGTSYSFGYDAGATQGHYGQVTSMTIPTTGQISYSFNKNVVATRTTSDGQWQYQFWQNTSGYQHQTIVTKPSSDQIVYTIQSVGCGSTGWSYYPVEEQFYNGAISSANLLATGTQTFNYTLGVCYAPGAGFAKIAESTTLPVPTGTVSKTSDYSWDSYGNVLQKSEWNFGSSTSNPADRTTTYTYLNGSSYVAANIVNRPASVTVTNSSGGTVAQTVNCYDYSGGCGGTSFASATGKSQHDDTIYPVTNTVRGDLTQVKNLISGTNYLTTSMTYDMTGQVLTSTDSAGNLTSYSYADNFYNDNGNTTNPVSYSPPAPTNAYVNTITQGSLVTTFGYYFGTGQKALSTDANSQTTYFHFYDSLNRSTSTKLPNLYNGTCCGWTYTVYPSASETQIDTGIGISSTSLSISCTGSAGDCRHDQTLLDSMGRMSSKILVSDPDNQTTTGTAYDSNGRLYSVSNPHRSSSLPTDGTEYYFYDGLDRKKQVTRSDGSNAYTYYGAQVGSNGRTSQLCSGFGVGYPVLYQDEAARLRQTWTDGFGRLIEVDEPDPLNGSLTSGSPAGTCYSYDLNNNLTGVTQGSQTRSFSYDMVSRLTAATNPESGTINYYYTTSGGSLCSGDMSAVCRRTDARSRTTTYAYDALNRLTSKSYSDSTPGVAYGYDAVAPTGCTPPTLTITNGKGRRTSMCDGPGATSWSYDPVGNVVTEKRTTNSVTDSFTYAYNLDSTVATVGYPSGRTITYQPGGAQRPLWVKDVTNSINYVTAAHYFPPGELGSLTNGSSINFTTITNNRLQPCWIYATTGTALSWSGTLCTTTETTAGNILDLEYGFNFGSSDNGNVMGITNNRDNTRSQSFSYDYRNRIKTAETTSTYANSPANCWSELYSIDTLGNLLSIAPPSGTYPTNPYGGCVQESGFSTTVNSQNQNASSCFDASGNNVGAAAPSPPYCTPLPTTYAYNAENQLTSTAGVTYSYDGDGKRVQKTSGTLYWYGTSPDPLLETNGSGTLTYEFISFGGKRTARRDSSSSIDYYFSDQLGTSRVVTNASGTIQDDSDFYPYGGERPVIGPSSGNRYKFTGKERDSESGLDNFGARYDSSQHGRFMTPDWSARPTPVPFADLANPQSLNLYSYVANNPLSRIDKDGHYACQGSQAQCKSFKDALAIVQKADSGLKEGSKERKQLDSVLKFYGKDDGKGPAIKFGDLGGMGAVGVTQTDHGKTTITFDTTALGGMTKVGQGETAAHEGTHGRDDHMRGVGAGLFWKFYDTEYHAYQSESYVDMGLGKASETDEYPSWAPGMSYSDHVRNITRNAYDNAVLDCRNAGCAP
jgi:RHS repeat-associated protein